MFSLFFGKITSCTVKRRPVSDHEFNFELFVSLLVGSKYTETGTSTLWDKQNYFGNFLMVLYSLVVTNKD